MSSSHKSNPAILGPPPSLEMFIGDCVYSAVTARKRGDIITSDQSPRLALRASQGPPLLPSHSGALLDGRMYVVGLFFFRSSHIIWIIGGGAIQIFSRPGSLFILEFERKTEGNPTPLRGRRGQRGREGRRTSFSEQSFQSVGPWREGSGLHSRLGSRERTPRNG